MMRIPFGAIKAPLVLALPVGARFQTRRPIPWAWDGSGWASAVLPARERGYVAWWPTPPSEALAEFTKKQYATGHMPTYRAGEVLAVAVPHWRLTPLSSRTPSGRQVLIVSGEAHLFRYQVEGDEWFQWSLDPIGDAETFARRHGGRRMAARYMPAWAATAWVRVLSAEPQRIQDVTEEDAKAELVEMLHATIGGYHWRSYSPKAEYCLSARHSYRTMVCAENGKDVWTPNGFFWKYVLQTCEKPEAEGAEACRVTPSAAAGTAFCSSRNSRRRGGRARRSRRNAATR